MADVEKLRKLKELFQEGILTRAEYDERRLKIIDGDILNIEVPTSSSTPSSSSSRSNPSRSTSAISPRATSSSPRATSRATATSPRATSSSPRQTSSDGIRRNRPSSPRHEVPISRSPPEQSTSPRAKFDSSQPYDPYNRSKAKEDHQKPSIPAPPKGKVGAKFEMPDAVRAFTQLKVVQEPENPKVGVYLGPKGGTGGVYASQADVRRKQPIGAPEVSTRAHIGAAADKISSVVVYTLGNIAFDERIFANTNCLDLISACVRKLEVLHPPSYFGMMQKTSSGESWISPDTLMTDVSKGGQLIVLPKQSTPEEIKKAYFSKINRKPESYSIETDGPAVDIDNAPNLGAQHYYQSDKKNFY